MSFLLLLFCIVLDEIYFRGLKPTATNVSSLLDFRHISNSVCLFYWVLDTIFASLRSAKITRTDVAVKFIYYFLLIVYQYFKLLPRAPTLRPRGLTLSTHGLTLSTRGLTLSARRITLRPR